MKYSLIVIIFFCLGCFARSQKSLKSNQESSIDTSKYAIFKVDTANWRRVYFHQKVKPATITNADIENIEHQIKARVAKYNSMESPRYDMFPIKDPSTYFKQIIAVINSKGEKEVWVNCICRTIANRSDRQRQIIQMLDGGSCFFQITINLTTRVVTNFAVNGPG